MREYTVTIPLAGYIKIATAGTSESEAIDNAMKIAGSIEIDGASITEEVIEIELNPYEKMSQGNVHYYDVNSINVQKGCEIED